MILRLLITVMMLLAVAKYYLHDTKQTEQTRPSAQVEEFQNQLNDIRLKQAEQKKQQLEQLGL